MDDNRRQRSIEFLKKDVLESRNYYKEHSDRKRLSIILMGDPGSGKTMLSRTMIRPIHIDSFDRGATNNPHLRDLIDKGDIIVDSHFDTDDPLKPYAFELWCRKFRERVDNGYFNFFGTYILDSFSTWSESVMYAVLKKKDRLGEIPKFETDYTLQKGDILTWIRRIVNLPCDIMMTGHLEHVEKADTVNSRWRLATVGTAAIPIMMQFDEKWIAIVRTVAGRPEYKIITAPINQYMAATRLGDANVIRTEEEADIKKIRARAGWSTNDLPPLNSYEIEK